MKKITLLAFSLEFQLVFLIPVDNPKCSEGEFWWQYHSKCYKVHTQGPCPKDEVLLNSYTGPRCAMFQDEDQEVIQTETPAHGIPKSEGWSIKSILSGEPTEKELVKSWLLPKDENATLSSEVNLCLEKEQIFWPADQQCYSLLTQGPCKAHNWLVLRDSSHGIEVVCSPRNCPCDPAAPDLCEVEVEEGECKCKVALAAAQDGICNIGEQLLVNPYGYGECGCISSPPHAVWPSDGRCYPMYSQGPCEQGFIFAISEEDFEPACIPMLCKEGMVMFEGSCHYLGYQGACKELEILTLDSATLEPQCKLNTSKVKRVYDVIPSTKGFITDGRLLNTFKVQDCKRDSSGKCRRRFYVKKSLSRSRNNNLYVKKRKPRSYLNWLKNFRKTNRRHG